MVDFLNPKLSDSELMMMSIFNVNPVVVVKRNHGSVHHLMIMDAYESKYSKIPISVSVCGHISAVEHYVRKNPFRNVESRLCKLCKRRYEKLLESRGDS